MSEEENKPTWGYGGPEYSPTDTWESSLSESDKLLHAYYEKKKRMHNLHGKELVEAGWELTRMFNSYWESKNKFHAIVYKHRFGVWQKILRILR